MTQYNSLNVKSSNWQLYQSTSGIKHGTKLILNLSENMNGTWWD